MKASEQLLFGRYTGRIIENVWTGLNPFNDNDVINRYLFELCSFLLNINNIEEIPSSKFNIHAHSNEIIFFSQSNIPKTVTVNNDKIHIDCADRNIPIALFKVLSNILSNSFKTIPQYYTKKPIGKCIGHSINSIRFQLLQADPTYIQWCIKNVDFFFFEPNELEQLCNKKCRYLTHFKFSQASENIFHFEPIFENSRFTLTNLAVQENRNKFSRNGGEHGNALYDISPISVPNNLDFCAACHESPCMCSNRERTSTIFDF